jgi:2-C-methyl-D-erythritol 4-phosphate cytidylyltransferase
MNLLVQWNRFVEAEATWEREDDWRESYPQLFVYALLNLEDEILLRGVEFVTPKI